MSTTNNPMNDQEEEHNSNSIKKRASVALFDLPTEVSKYIIFVSFILRKS
jgi:hypothetical protein